MGMHSKIRDTCDTGRSNNSAFYSRQMLPAKCRMLPRGAVYAPCKTLEHTLHPWVAFGILPVFAFANAGVPFSGMGLHSLADPVTLGIALGLLIGKPLGIFTFLFIAIKTGCSPMPDRVDWIQIFAVSILCGIGFTMSLFIGGLAFESLEMQASVRLGVLSGSLVAAVVGFLILYSGSSDKKVKENQ